MLTRKQANLLRYISDQITKDGVSPSFDEMKDALGLKSKSGVHRLIMALEERGFVRRLPHRARALEILRLPSASSYDRKAMEPGVALRPAFAGARRHVEPGESELQLFGRIAAGTPIEALRDPDRLVSVPKEMCGRGEHYALEVSGDSMVGAGILDGDTVVIRRCEEVETGAIVVALVDNREATLKVWRSDEGKVVLEAANDAYPPQVYEPEQVAIQGRLVGLVREY